MENSEEKSETLEELVLENIFILFLDEKPDRRILEIWVTGEFEKNIRIDPPTHLSGSKQHKLQKHAHILDRGRNQILVVNQDGTASHGTKGTLSKKNADALKKRGFKVEPGDLIQFTPISSISDLRSLFANADDISEEMLDTIYNLIRAI
jgi:hypothetical protein